MAILTNNFDGLTHLESIKTDFVARYSPKEKLFSLENQVDLQLLANEVVGLFEKDFIKNLNSRKSLIECRYVLNTWLCWSLALIKHKHFPKGFLATSKSKKNRYIKTDHPAVYVNDVTDFKNCLSHFKNNFNSELCSFLTSNESSIDDRFNFTQTLHFYKIELKNCEMAFFQFENKFLNFNDLSTIGKSILERLFLTGKFPMLEKHREIYRASFDRFRVYKGLKKSKNANKSTRKRLLDIVYKNKKTKKRGNQNFKRKENI